MTMKNCSLMVWCFAHFKDFRILLLFNIYILFTPSFDGKTSASSDKQVTPGFPLLISILYYFENFKSFQLSKKCFSQIVVV